MLKYGLGLSAKQLHERLLAKVHSQFEQQTPQLQGEGQDALFGVSEAAILQAATVSQVDSANKRVRLTSAGQAFGNRKGAQFAIYPYGTTDFSDASKRQAIATITEVGATDSWAAITTSFTDAPIEQGAPAMLLDQGSLKLVRKVGLVSRDDLPPEIDQTAALQAVRSAMADNPWVAEATADDTLEYQVAVNEAGAYEIWDPAGQPVANLRPPIQVGAPDAASAVVQRLVHLTKYHAAQQLDNHDPLSPLARKLMVELVGVQDDYDPGERPEPEPFREPGNTPVLKTGQWTFLRIRNDAAQPLNVAVLDLQPDWGISQVYPSGAGDWSAQFEPGHEELIPLKADLPADCEEGTDVVKVFATVGAANLRRLELPALGAPRTRSAGQRASATPNRRNPLEELLDALGGEQPPPLTTRTLTTAAYPSREWTAASVEVHMRRAAP